MKNLVIYSFRLIVLVLLFAILSGSSCEDDTISSPTEHFEAVGIIIYSSGVKVFDYFGPDYDPTTSALDDTIKIQTGLTPRWEAKFYDENRNEINSPTDPDNSFSARIDDTNLLNIQWNTGEEGSFSFYLNGLMSGSTKIKFQILHGEHPDFETLPVVVTIN